MFKILIFPLQTFFDTACHLVTLKLPPGNEVWGEVIFSQARVIPPVHGGFCLLQGDCIQRGLHPDWSASRGVGQTPQSAYRGGGSVSRLVGQNSPLDPGKWAVRIILECFLVKNSDPFVISLSNQMFEKHCNIKANSLFRNVSLSIKSRC